MRLSQAEGAAEIVGDGRALVTRIVFVFKIKLQPKMGYDQKVEGGYSRRPLGRPKCVLGGPKRPKQTRGKMEVPLPPEGVRRQT